MAAVFVGGPCAINGGVADDKIIPVLYNDNIRAAMDDYIARFGRSDRKDQ